ncbi:hypothetical protein CEQ90_00670 [Lewinellaceae bacterium SD302]|nr:hypothetical protein CEQ90_00670 [Lewinellaceae bacterium SD302]
MRLFLSLLFFLSFSSGMVYSQVAIPYRHGNMWGFADESGWIIITPKYEAVGEFVNGMAWVKKKNKYGFINRLGEEVIKAKYKEVSDFGLDASFVRRGNKSYYLDRHGRRTVLGGVRCYNELIVHHFETYTASGKIGLLGKRLRLSRTGSKVFVRDTLKAIWEDFRQADSHPFAAVKLNGKWGIIKSDWEMMVDYKYDDVLPNTYQNLPDHTFVYRLENKYGFLDESGEVLIEAKYYQAEPFNKRGLAKVWLNKHYWGYIDKTGREYFFHD